jgi:hypothetical protein
MKATAGREKKRVVLYNLGNGGVLRKVSNLSATEADGEFNKFLQLRSVISGYNSVKIENNKEIPR